MVKITGRPQLLYLSILIYTSSCIYKLQLKIKNSNNLHYIRVLMSTTFFRYYRSCSFGCFLRTTSLFRTGLCFSWGWTSSSDGNMDVYRYWIENLGFTILLLTTISTFSNTSCFLTSCLFIVWRYLLLLFTAVIICLKAIFILGNEDHHD